MLGSRVLSHYRLCKIASIVTRPDRSRRRSLSARSFVVILDSHIARLAADIDLRLVGNNILIGRVCTIIRNGIGPAVIVMISELIPSHEGRLAYLRLVVARPLVNRDRDALSGHLHDVLRISVDAVRDGATRYRCNQLLVDRCRPRGNLLVPAAGFATREVLLCGRPFNLTLEVVGLLLRRRIFVTFRCGRIARLRCCRTEARVNLAKVDVRRIGKGNDFTIIHRRYGVVESLVACRTKSRQVNRLSAAIAPLRRCRDAIRIKRKDACPAELIGNLDVSVLARRGYLHLIMDLLVACVELSCFLNLDVMGIVLLHRDNDTATKIELFRFARVLTLDSDVKFRIACTGEFFEVGIVLIPREGKYRAAHRPMVVLYDHLGAIIKLNSNVNNATLAARSRKSGRKLIDH